MDKSDDLDRATQRLNQVVTKAITDSVPRGSCKKAYFCWSDEVEAAVSTRRKALKVMQENNSEEHGKQYQDACAEASRVVMASKREAWQRYCDGLDGSGSVAGAWKTIASLSGKRGAVRTASPLIQDGHEYTLEREKAPSTTCKHDLSTDVNRVLPTMSTRRSENKSRSTLRRVRLRSLYIEGRELNSALSMAGAKIDEEILCADGTHQFLGVQ